MLYHAQGTAILTEDELFETPTVGNIKDFFAALDRGRTPAPIEFSTGRLDVGTVIRGFAPDTKSAPVPFAPIGLGLPLTVVICEVYTGKYPNSVFSKKSDLLVTSAIKSIATYDAKPRALNFLANGVSAGAHIKRPSAAKEGTPLVFYSPAVIDKSLTLDLTMVFDKFPKEVFSTIGDTVQAAAGIPIFFAHSAYLLAAGAVAKIVGSAGEALFDGRPDFSACEALNISWPGAPQLLSGFAVITDGNVDSIDPDFRSKYQINASGQVVNKAGKAYDGKAPYIVICIDGTLHEEFSSFTPTAASAAILSRFFGMKEGTGQVLGSLLDAVKLYNDFTFRQEIDRLDKQLAGLTDGDEKTALKKKRDALAKNILTDLLKKA